MKRFDMIIEDIYNSKDYKIKGYSICILDEFFIEKNGELYLVLIMEKSNFNKNVFNYDYVIYSLTNKKYIEKESNDFMTLVKDFPLLKNIKFEKYINFIEKNKLKNIFYDLVDKCYENAKLSNDMIDSYNKYLNDFSKALPKSYKELYNFFKL